MSSAPLPGSLWTGAVGESQRSGGQRLQPQCYGCRREKLLQHSLQEDGFTQPVVVSEEKGQYRRGWFSPAVAGQTRVRSRKTPERLVARHLYQSRNERGRLNELPRTIRHNRARGKHQIASMSDIVRTLPVSDGQMNVLARSWEWTGMKFFV